MATVQQKKKAFNKPDGKDRKSAFLKKSNEIKVKKGLVPAPTIQNIKRKVVVEKKPEWWLPTLGQKSAVLVQLAEGTMWYDGIPAFEMEEGTQNKVPREILNEIMAAVPKAYEEEVRHFQSMKKKSMDSDQKWIADVVKSGTLTDKVAALALSIQESPVHQLSSLDLLVEMALNKKQQRTSQIALEALKDLMLHNLLPDRKLQPFSKQALGHPDMTMKAALVLWYEGQLAVRVGKMLDALDFGLRCTTSVDFFKKTCLSIVSELLIAKPEQEARLLNMLVNKLADPAPAVSNKAIELLKLVIKNHEMMKLHIVKEVKSLIYQTNTSPKAIFTCTVYLTQIPLVPHRDAKVAEELIDCYVSLFEKALVNSDKEAGGSKGDKKGGKGKGKGKGKLSEKEKQAEQAAQNGSRLLAILLNGINHAYPCVTGSSVGSGLTKHMDALYKIVHTTSFSTATQALMLLSQAVLKDDEAAMGTAANKNPKRGGALRKEKAAAATGTTAPSRSALEEDAANRFFRALYSQLSSEQVCSRSKNTLFLNLLYRSLKRDDNKERIMSFVKRMCMASTQAGPAITAGLLLLISEVCKASAGNSTVLPAMTELAPVAPLGMSKKVGDDESDDDEDDHKAAENRGLFECYDSAKRDPAYAMTKGEGVSSSEGTTSGICLWELNLLQQHFHPSVRAFADSLVNMPDDSSVNPHEISFAGDPISEFSLTAFLDRLSYKNSKKQTRAKKTDTEEDVPINLDSKVNSAFDDEMSSVVAPDKVFFHKYFGSRIQLREEGRSRDRTRHKSSKAEDGDSDAEDVNSEDEMDAYTDKLMEAAMKSNQPIDVDDEDYDSNEDMDGDDSGSEGGDLPSDVDNDMDGLDDSDDGEDSEEEDGDDIFAEAPVSDDETDMDQYYINKYGGTKFNKGKPVMKGDDPFADEDEDDVFDDEINEEDDEEEEDPEPMPMPTKKRKQQEAMVGKSKPKDKNKKRK